MREVQRNAIIMYISLTTLLGFTTFNAITNHNDDHKYEKLLNDLQVFMNRGGRFTENDGRRLEARIIALEKKLEKTD